MYSYVFNFQVFLVVLFSLNKLSRCCSLLPFFWHLLRLFIVCSLKLYYRVFRALLYVLRFWITMYFIFFRALTMSHHNLKPFLSNQPIFWRSHGKPLSWQRISFKRLKDVSKSKELKESKYPEWIYFLTLFVLFAPLFFKWFSYEFLF